MLLMPHWGSPPPSLSTSKGKNDDINGNRELGAADHAARRHTHTTCTTSGPKLNFGIWEAIRTSHDHGYFRTDRRRYPLLLSYVMYSYLRLSPQATSPLPQRRTCGVRSTRSWSRPEYERSCLHQPRARRQDPRIPQHQRRRWPKMMMLSSPCCSSCLSFPPSCSHSWACRHRRRRRKRTSELLCVHPLHPLLATGPGAATLCMRERGEGREEEEDE